MNREESIRVAMRIEALELELAATREQVSSRNKRLMEMARVLEQERQDRKQADLDTIRALGERNDARAQLAKVRDQLADYIQADLDDSVMRSAATWRPLPGDPEQFYPPCVCGWCDGTSCNHGT